MFNKLMAAWNGLSPKTKQWLKGAEAAVVTAIVAAFVAAPASNFSTKSGIAEFAAGIASAAYAALRLYMTQNPVPITKMVKENSETLTVGDVSKTTSSTETTTSEPIVATSCVNCGADPVVGAPESDEQKTQFISGTVVVPQSEHTDDDVVTAPKPAYARQSPIHPDIVPTAVSNPRITRRAV